LKVHKINIDIKRKIWNYLQDNSIANRGHFDGSKENQLLGLIAEFEIHNILLGFYPEFKEGFDNGVDIIYNDYTIDVKCMGRTVDCKKSYVNNFLECQLKYNTDIIIFTSINKIENNLQVCGWLWKKELIEKGTLYKKGEKRYRDDSSYFILAENTYEVLNKDLNNFNYDKCK